MGDHDNYQALMLDYAAGALPAASALLVETHFALRPEAAVAAQAADIAGGALLEDLTPAGIGLPRVAPGASAGPPVAEIGAARDMIGAVLGDAEAAPWRRRPLGVRECDLPVAGLTLLRLAGGRSTPAHGHHGEELTLVLHGLLEDELGAYAPGDIAFADEQLVHRPRVPAGPDCVCLISRAAPTKFLGLLGLVAAIWPEPSSTEVSAMLKIALAAMLAFAAATGAAIAAAAPGRLEFEVLRNGEPFGKHEFVVTRASGIARVEERARFAAKLGPLTVFRYEHDCTATWADDALATLGCSTLKDGRRTRFSGERQGDSFVVQRREGARAFDAQTPPTIFLTPNFLTGGVYIDTETGELRTVRVTRVGSETIEVAGHSIEAQRYRVRSTLTMDLWYDGDGRWVKGAFTARGQDIEYRLASPISAAPR